MPPETAAKPRTQQSKKAKYPAPATSPPSPVCSSKSTLLALLIFELFVSFWNTALFLFSEIPSPRSSLPPAHNYMYNAMIQHHAIFLGSISSTRLTAFSVLFAVYLFPPTTLLLYSLCLSSLLYFALSLSQCPIPIIISCYIRLSFLATDATGTIVNACELANNAGKFPTLAVK